MQDEIYQRIGFKTETASTLFGKLVQICREQFNNNENLNLNNKYKDELELIYNHNAEGARIRPKCDWYE